MAELKNILLSNIDPLPNYREVEPVNATDPDIIELAENIKENEVYQPILVRPHPTIAGRYERICGERRQVASLVAGKKDIPAYIRDIPDEDILEIQITENLQRKDAHPFDEANGFKSLMKEKGYTVEDIAAKFNQKLDFITQRLKLNDLIPEFQKTFKKNILSVGQAFVLCRLRPEDQKTFRKEWKDEEFEPASIYDVQDWINRNLLRQLSSASFKRDDATLNPKAGPCTTCTKRSGCGNLLFNDLKEDDRCFDAACFQSKQDAFFLQQLQKTVETKPEVHLVAGDAGKLPKEVKDLLRQMNVKVLDSGKYQQYGGYGKYKKQVKALFLDGYQRGKTDTIYVEGAAKATTKDKSGKTIIKRTIADIDLEISGIKDRQKRAKELELEKTHKATLQELEKKTELKKPGLKHQGLVDRGIMIFLLLHKAAGSQAGRDVRKNIKAMPKEPGYSPHAYQIDYIKKLGALTDDDVAYMIRVICLDHYGNKNLVNGIDEDDTTLRLMAEYSGVDLKSIEAEQKVITDKRIERADKRLEVLKAEKKLLEEKKPAKVEKITTAKKAAKKASDDKINKSIKSLIDQAGPGALISPGDDPEDAE